MEFLKNKGQKEARSAKITAVSILVLNLFYFLWLYINVWFLCILAFFLLIKNGVTPYMLFYKLDFSYTIKCGKRIS